MTDGVGSDGMAPYDGGVERRAKRRAKLLSGFRRVPAPLLEHDGATELLVIGPADASTVVYLQAGFPDDQTAFVGLARKLAQDDDCLVGLGCMPEFDNTTGTMLRPGGYSFDQIALCFSQSVATLRAESTDSSSTLVIGMHDWGVVPGCMFARRACKAGNRALCPAKVICFDVLPPVAPPTGGSSTPLSSFKGVPMYTVFVHLVYRAAFASVFALSRISTFLGTILLGMVHVCFIIFSRCLNPTSALDAERGMGPSVRKPQLVANCCYPYFQMFKEGLFGGALLTELGLPPLERMPLLFIYGKEKNTMFHTQAALALIDAAEGSAQFGLEGAAHWCYKQKEDECVRLVRAFLNDNAKKL